MDRYLIRKILKNILICLFACWALFEIREFSVYGGAKTAIGRRNLENSEFFIGNTAADHRDAEALRKIIGKTEIIGESLGFPIGQLGEIEFESENFSCKLLVFERGDGVLFMRKGERKIGEYTVRLGKDETEEAADIIKRYSQEE